MDIISLFLLLHLSRKLSAIKFFFDFKYLYKFIQRLSRIFAAFYHP